jgi:hypothetical protein
MDVNVYIITGIGLFYLFEFDTGRIRPLIDNTANLL